MDLIELLKFVAPWLQAGAWAGFIIIAYFYYLERKERLDLRTKYDLLQEARAKDAISQTTVLLQATAAMEESTSALEAHGRLLQPLLYRGTEK